MGEEKRRAHRVPLFLELEISSLFKQDNIKAEIKNSLIEITDISRTGIGFVSSSILPNEYYFNAKISLGNDYTASLYCVVQIIRSQTMEDGRTKYGCEFVGFPPILNYIIDNYEERYMSNKDNK